MSWLFNPEATPTRHEESDPKVPDPSDPSVLVSNKSANQPFLAYKKYREEQENLHREWSKRNDLRNAAIARGEKVGRAERDPTAQVEVGLWGIIKFLLMTFAIVALAGKYVTGDFFWDMDWGKWGQLSTYVPAQQRLFTDRVLAKYDGSNPQDPIYIALDGDVYDVSSNRRVYGPGGSYHVFAGKDAARAYATGCFQTHITHDLRGLSESEQKSIVHWKKFFAEHKTYRKIGRVNHHPIDPASPIPEHCNPDKNRDNSNPRKETKEQTTHPNPKEGKDEL